MAHLTSSFSRFYVGKHDKQETNTEFRMKGSRKEATWCEMMRRLEDNFNYL